MMANVTVEQVLFSSLHPPQIIPTTHDLGELQRTARTLPSANAPHHGLSRGSRCMTRVTFGKSRVWESRTLGSVRAKPNG